MTRRWLSAAISSALAHLPSVCPVCRGWPAQAVCADCVARFAAPVARCCRCAIPVGAGTAQCGQCLRTPPPLDACVAACSYGWPWTSQIGLFKFQGEAGRARPFAALMGNAPGAQALLDGADLVLPVPLAPGRLRERGFNQSLELARRLAPQRCDATLLQRTRETRAQSGLGRAERLRNLHGAFALAPHAPDAVRGLRLLLVDDVMTSGASLHECARTLKAQGAAEVSAIVLARTDQPAQAELPAGA